MNVVHESENDDKCTVCVFFRSLATPHADSHADFIHAVRCCAFVASHCIDLCCENWKHWNTCPKNRL